KVADLVPRIRIAGRRVRRRRIVEGGVLHQARGRADRADACAYLVEHRAGDRFEDVEVADAASRADVVQAGGQHDHPFAVEGALAGDRIAVAQAQVRVVDRAQRRVVAELPESLGIDRVGDVQRVVAAPAAAQAADEEGLPGGGG